MKREGSMSIKNNFFKIFVITAVFFVLVMPSGVGAAKKITAKRKPTPQHVLTGPEKVQQLKTQIATLEKQIVKLSTKKQASLRRSKLKELAAKKNSLSTLEYKLSPEYIASHSPAIMKTVMFKGKLYKMTSVDIEKLNLITPSSSLPITLGASSTTGTN